MNGRHGVHGVILGGGRARQWVTPGASEAARGPDAKESVMAAIRNCGPEGRS